MAKVKTMISQHDWENSETTESMILPSDYDGELEAECVDTNVSWGSRGKKFIDFVVTALKNSVQPNLTNDTLRIWEGSIKGKVSQPESLPNTVILSIKKGWIDKITTA